MSELQNQKRWTAYGRKLEKGKNNLMVPSQSTEYPFDISEKIDNIDMGDHTVGPFGIPISTGLAVSLIKNMLDELDNSGNGFFLQSLNETEKVINNGDILKQLLLNSMGVTFDKSQLLRIISQPECEGVRFYHAIRKNQDGESNSATLVCVGVDKDGYDLHYSNSPIKDIQARQNDTCESLVDDWGHPPGAAFTNSLNDKINNPRYVLWRMASGK